MSKRPTVNGDDLVERIRATAKDMTTLGQAFDVLKVAEALEARDAEIERLRLRVEQLENGHDAWKIALPLIMADRDAERAEVERLRAELELHRANTREAIVEEVMVATQRVVTAYQEARRGQ